MGTLGLQLLQHRGDVAPCEEVPRQEQHGQAVDRGARRGGDHVGGPRPDGGRAGERLQAVLHLGEGRRRVDHRLLVLGLIVAELGLALLLEGLPDSCDVPVPEDPPDAREERLLLAVALDVLLLQKLDERLGHGQPSSPSPHC